MAKYPGMLLRYSFITRQCGHQPARRASDIGPDIYTLDPGPWRRLDGSRECQGGRVEGLGTKYRKDPMRQAAFQWGISSPFLSSFLFTIYFKNIYLFIWLHLVLVSAGWLLSCSSLAP